MNEFLANCLDANEPPFLQTPQGWKFFLEVTELNSSHWLGTVHIYAGISKMNSIMRCVEFHATRGDALRDAQALAKMAFIKISVRFKAADDLERLRECLVTE